MNNDADEKAIACGIGWGVGVVLIWSFFMLPLACSKSDEVQREWEKKNFLVRAFTADGTGTLIMWLGVWAVGGAAVGAAAFFVAGAIVYANADDKANALQTREQEEALGRAQEQEAAEIEESARMEREASARDQMERLSSSKQELIFLLGSLDRFARAVEAEVDATRRAMALQDMQGVLTAALAKIVAGEILEDALRDERIRRGAVATKSDLVRIGLGSDRLVADIARVFQLDETATR